MLLDGQPVRYDRKGLAALRRRRQVLTILIAAVLTALLLWVAALCVSLYDYHQAYNGWSETIIIE